MAKSLRANRTYAGMAVLVTLAALLFWVLLIICAVSRSWGISTSHTSAQRRRFQAELETLSGYLNESGGPFLLGADVSLVGTLLPDYVLLHMLVLKLFAEANHGLLLVCYHMSLADRWFHRTRLLGGRFNISCCDDRLMVTRSLILSAACTNGV